MFQILGADEYGGCGGSLVGYHWHDFQKVTIAKVCVLPSGYKLTLFHRINVEKLEKLSFFCFQWCVTERTILHETLHALGLSHEQSRPDRDDFIEIVHENLRGKGHAVVKKQSAKHFSSFGVPYDGASIMHYGYTSASKNGKPTMLSKVRLLVSHLLKPSPILQTRCS